MTEALELDVRPILRNGGEPFGAIMGAVDQLNPGQALRLIAPFRPEPLFKVMATRGFDHEATQIEGGDWQVLFTRASKASVAGASEAGDPHTWPDPIEYLDLTDLDPPEPMVRILSRLEEMSEGTVLFALLAREPVFLYPELDSRGHAWVGDFDEEDVNYRLMVRRGGQR